MKHLIRFLIARALYYIRYLPDDIRQWRRARRRDRDFQKKLNAIIKKWDL